MKNLSTWLLAMFMVMFAGFRVIVTLTNQQGNPIAGLVVENIALEIGIIFLTLLCLVLVIKRKLLGAILYAISYGFYYGSEVFNTICNVLINGQTLATGSMFNLLISGIGVLLPLLVLFDTLIDKGRKISPVDKKTDWFFKNEQFDRKFDERADRNEYKF